MKSSLIRDRIAPVLTLFILSPIIAELLFGSTPLSRSSQLLMESVYYGSAAVLIREITRRNRLGWLSVISLGIAFGILEECLTLQSAFNPHFLGNDLTFGRAMGVNWIWGICIIGYHAVWSITIPIVFSELVFISRRSEPWLNKTGIWLFSVLFLLSSVAFFALFYYMSAYLASPIHFGIAALLAALFIWISSRNPDLIQTSEKQSFNPFLAGLTGFVASLLWLGLLLLVFKPGLGIHPAFAFSAAFLLIIILLFLSRLWCNEGWNEHHQFFLAAGCLYASMLFGLNTLFNSPLRSDFYFQLFLIVLVSLLLFLLKKRLNRSTDMTDIQEH